MTEDRLLERNGYTAWENPIRGKALEPGESEHSRYLWVEDHTPAGARVLDVGCNGGQMLRQLWQAKGIRGVGMDIDPKMIEFAESRRQRNGDAFPIRWIVAPGERAVEEMIGYPRFDVVIACEVIEHVDHIRPFLAAMYGVLADDGALLVTCPLPHSSSGYQFSHPSHRRVFTRFRLQVCLEVMGFYVTEYAETEKPPHGPMSMAVMARKVPF